VNAAEYERLVTAANGREARERLQAEPFDLVLLEVTMLELNGGRRGEDRTLGW
jgi:YesN/AraC family two-component response regulator